MATPLKGINVLEFSLLIPGDYLSMLLGDLGARVIKVENPRKGDYIRDILGQLAPHVSPFHLFLNRNKESVAVDLRTDQGRDIVATLIKQSDVIVDAFVAGVADRMGIGYEACKKLNDKVVYCHISAFGMKSPLRDLPTHGGVMNAAAGAMPLQTDADGSVHPVSNYSEDLGTAPAGRAVIVGPMFGAQAVLAALFNRERTGEGAFIDVSLVDAEICALWRPVIYGMLNRDREEKIIARPDDFSKRAKYNYYRTKDQRTLIFAGIEHKFWVNFCEAVDRPDLIGDQGDAAVDWGDDEQLRRELQSIFEQRDLADWIRLFVEKDIAGGPVNTPETLDNDPHVKERGVITSVRDERFGEFFMPTSPVGGAGHSVSVAPDLGQDTRRVLAEFGISNLDELQEVGVILQA